MKGVLIIEGKQRQRIRLSFFHDYPTFVLMDSQLQAIPDLGSSYVLEGPLQIPGLEFFIFQSLN